MFKAFVKYLLLFTFFTIFAASRVFAQATITVGTVPAGTYAQGSTITVPFHVDYTNGPVAQNNVFSLYRSDATGSFATQTLVGSTTAFYGNYINYTISTALAPSSLYKFKVVASDGTVVTANTSNAVTIGAGAAPTAATATATTNTITAEVFGQCQSPRLAPLKYTFTNPNAGAANTTVTLDIYDETGATPSAVVTGADITNAGYDFAALAKNYRITVTAVNTVSGVTSTRSYQLINNSVSTNLGSSGNNIACIDPTLSPARAEFNFTVDVTPLKNNYPGDLYTVAWGDGNSTKYSLAEIIAGGNAVSHGYTTPSCGITGLNPNAFSVALTASNTYCGTIGSPAGGRATVLKKPVNSIGFPTAAITGNACSGNVTFKNLSVPGPDALSTNTNCVDNPNQTYNWLINGVPVAGYQGVAKSVDFNHVFTSGSYMITLVDASGNNACVADPINFTLCVQDIAQPDFTVAAGPFCMNTPVTVVDASHLDANCNPAYVYNWFVLENGVTATGVTFAQHAVTPNFTFTHPGNYVLRLTITSPGGCTSSPVTKNITVVAPPTATLSPAFTLCGTGQTLTFDGTASSQTKTIFPNTFTGEGSTYFWSVTGPAGGATFVTTQTTQTPQIKFTILGTYTVSVVRTNACGASAAYTQDITLQDAPVPYAGNTPTTVCEGTGAISLNGSIGGVYDTRLWSIVSPIPGTGNITNASSLTPTFNPTHADFLHGSVTLRLTATTNALPLTCRNVTSDITITLVPTTIISSPNTKAICSGNAVNYTITSNNDPTATYAWTATVTSGTLVTPPPATGTGNSITDVLTNVDPTTIATIKYHITPTTNTCDGTPFDLIVTLNPVPVISSTGASTVCSGQTYNITTNLLNTPGTTTYKWTSSGVGVTGNSNPVTFMSNANIADVLVNHTNAVVTVTYIITPYNLSGCPGDPKTVTVDVYPPPTTANAGGPTLNFCGLATPPHLNANAAGTGETGTWTIVTQPTGATVSFDNPNDPNTIVNGMADGGSYTFRWTIANGNNCSTTDVINVTVTPATVAGTTSSDATVCSGTSKIITLGGGYVGSILKWQTSSDGITYSDIANTNGLTAYTTPNLTATTVAKTYYYRAVVQSGACGPPLNSTATVITVSPPTPLANAGTPQTLCGSTSMNLNATANAGFDGFWTQNILGSEPTVTFTDITDPHTLVSGLTAGFAYTFTWTVNPMTVNGVTPCSASTAQVTITSTLATVAGTTSGAVTVCYGGNNGAITLTGAVGSITWEKSANIGGPWTPTGNTTTTQTYLNLTTSTYYHAVVQSGACGPPLTSNATLITVNPPAIVASITGSNSQILCNASTANLVGNDPGIYTGQWVQIQLGNEPLANIPSPHNYSTTATDLVGGYVYTFRWIITGLNPCPDTQADLTITNNADVVPSFTNNDPAIACGNLTVQFTNTSNNQTGANFLWNFGDGSTSNAVNPQHTFAQRSDGKDTTYTVSLSVLGNCAPHPDFTQQITVRPAIPIATVLPASTNGCGNFALEVRNTSPGNNVSYDFYLYDGTTLVQKITTTNKNNVIFDPLAPIARKTFTLYMVATGYCGTTNESTHIPIVISPANITAQFFLQDDVHSGCAPLNTVFVNNSFGGNNYFYTIYDVNNNIVAKPVASGASLPYTFTTAGTYYVTLTAINSCGFNESPRTRVDVFPVPKPAFVADVTTGCKDARITFTNNTTTDDPLTPASSLLYDWDFGDGTPHSALFSPTHAYHFTNTPYTVTLTATNTASGCVGTATRVSYIVLSGPPLPAFSVKPDSVTTIPNYTFTFIDESTRNPVSWKWKFSDGRTSNLRNPTVTFADTGYYKVTLTTATAIGCDTSITKTVRITGVPGQLFIPNAFVPSSGTTELQTFKSKGSGIKEWHLQIFNNYGQLIWETTKLNAKGEPDDGWDGTYKGVPMPQGVYQWQASATFINGLEWKGNSYKDELPKRVGSIHLIR